MSTQHFPALTRLVRELSTNKTKTVSGEDEPIGLAQAAEEFSIARRTLSKAAADGLLKACKTAGAWIVTRAAVRRYINESKPKMGRPPGKKSSDTS